jgi:hypothetical protein
MAAMPEPWRSRLVGVVLPRELAEAMFRRAELWDVEKGGRFDRRSAAVLVWSTNANASEQGEPVGGFYVRWHDPDENSATVWKVERDPKDGSEDEVWRALEVLAGQPIRKP